MASDEHVQPSEVGRIRRHPESYDESILSQKVYSELYRKRKVCEAQVLTRWRAFMHSYALGLCIDLDILYRATQYNVSMFYATTIHM